MGLYRVTETQAQVVLGCGHDVTFEIADCRVRGSCVHFPVCPTCRKAYGMVLCVVHGNEAGSDVLERDAAIHTLHARVHALGLFMDGAKPEEVKSDMHPLARKESVVEALSAKRA